MSLGLFYNCGFTLMVTFLIVPYIRKLAIKLEIIAHQNERTIHTGLVPRIGGVALYLGFLFGMNLFAQADYKTNVIMIGGFVILMLGLFDDIFELKPAIKTIVEVAVALFVIFQGDLYIQDFSLPFLPTLTFGPLMYVITLLWIIGITNAINLIDGLDGLAVGTSTIVFFTLSAISLRIGRGDVALLGMILVGACLGLLFFNFHPASIFLGDSGALFLGYMISVVSLLGFGYKSATFLSLYAPIMILIVPISDTLIAIIRRKLKGKKYNEADKEHLHHTLLFKMNISHTASVLILYGITALFSLSAYIYTFSKVEGLTLFVMLMIMFELYVEYSGMISSSFHPLIGIAHFIERKWKKWKERS